MKRLLSSLSLRGLAALFIITAASHSAFAQAPAPTPRPSVILTTEYHVRPGVMPEYLEWIKTVSRPMYLKGGAKRTEVYTTVFGDVGTVYVMEYFSSFADMTASKAAFSQKVGADAMKAWNQKGTSFLAATPRQVVMRSEPDLSWRNPKVSFATPPKYYVVRRRWITHTREGDYVKHMKNDYLPLIKNAERPGVITTSLRLGDQWQFFVSSPLAELADLDKQNEPLKGITPAEWDRVRKNALAGVITKSDTIVIRFRDDLSISTQQSQEANK